MARLQTRVQQLACSLLELPNVPAVREHLLLIEAMAGDEWWQDVTLPMLEQARRKLRSLVKLVEKSSRKVVYTDFEDALGEASEVALPLVASAVVKKLIARPQKPSSSTGRRPKRSDSAPRMGAATNCASA